MTRNTRLFLVLVLLTIFASAVHAQNQTALLLPQTDISLNATTTVDVTLECPAANCIGIDVSIAYDPDVIGVEAVNAGDFLGDSPRIIQNQVESPGTLRFSALSSAGATRPAEGVVFSLDLTGLTLGESELTVTNISVFRRGGTVQATTEPGLITVIEGGVETESATAEATSEAASEATAEATVELNVEIPDVTLTMTRRLTLRGGPGPQFDQVGSADSGVALQVLGISEDGAWYLILLPDGSQGWLATSRFITFEGDVNTLPIVTGEIALPTVAPTNTPEPPTVAPTDTPTSEPTAAETEVIEPVQTEEATVEAVATEVPVEAVTTEPTKTEAPTEVPPTETPIPTSTLLPTATLNTGSGTEEGEQVTKTPETAASSTPLPTNTPPPTETPLPTNTPLPLATATSVPTNTPAPCTVTTPNSDVAVHVGPNRAVRATFPANQVIRVTGQQQADDGSLWYQIEPLGGSQEADRFWVLQTDVVSQGDCDLIGNAESPQVIGGGGGGTSFSSTFRPGQPSINHTIRIGTAGNYTLTCSGSPVYPEFSVGSSRSRGQTTLSLNLTPGSYTLTVFGTTQNATGQNINISSYNCSLTRR